jgi:hypothetical protein
MNVESDEYEQLLRRMVVVVEAVSVPLFAFWAYNEYVSGSVGLAALFVFGSFMELLFFQHDIRKILSDSDD